jgi:MoaA/NifB/PqqE/SkfB family radical SAM enzyme
MDKKQFIPIYKEDDGKGSFVWFTSKLLDETYNLDLLSIIKNSPFYRKEPGYEPEYTETLRKQVPDNFCLYPFTHFQLDPDGRARPCCKYKVGDPTWQADVPKLPDVDIGELWDQTEFQNLRDQFLRNERPSGCKACWDEEAAGITSMRLVREQGGKEHPYATFFQHIPRLYPKTLDLKLSNLCNLKCRICTPFLSSQWIKEIKDLKINDMGSIESFTGNSKEKFSANPNNEEILKQWAPTIDFLEFYGGEPLMQQEHDKILDIMSSHGNPTNTSLYYNTNSSICTESFFKLWKKFKQVVINFSVDDIKERFEYERKNAKWSESLENITRYRALSNQYGVNMHIRIYVTVGVLNVFYLKEFFEEIKKLGVKIVLNMVHYPHHYAITILPTKVKDVIKEKLETIDATNMLHHTSPSIQNIINFMYGNPTNIPLLHTFFEKTTMHDEYRKESFKDTFPDFYELLKGYR